MVLEEVARLEKLAGKVYPKMAIELVDQNGNKILSNANILKDYEVSGIDATAFEKGQLPVTITLKPGQLYNPFKLTAVLTDKNSSKSIDIKATLTIK